MDEDVMPEAAEEEYDEYEEDLEDEIENEEEDAETPAIEDYEEPEILESKLIPIKDEDENHRIIRVIADDKRKTSNVIQWPEMVEAIGIRASQIEMGAPILTDVSGYTDPIAMAKKEFIDRKSPLILQRIMKKTDTYLIVEWWKVRDMTFPVTNREVMELTSKKIAEMQAKKT